MRILAIGAHPDDAEIGCGGTLLLHRRVGDTLTLVVVSDGAMGGDSAIRRTEQESSARMLGAELVMLGRPDCDLGSSLSVELSAVVDKISPDVVYTHSSDGVHGDHAATHAAAVAAARDISSLLLFESPRSSLSARGVFVDISSVIDDKVDLLHCHGSQLIKSPFLSINLLKARSAIHGAQIGAEFAERFEVVRLVRVIT